MAGQHVGNRVKPATFSCVPANGLVFVHDEIVLFGNAFVSNDENLNAFWYLEIQGADLSGMVRDHSLLCKVERQMVVGNVAFFSIDRLCSGDADSILVSGINGFANTPSQGLKFGNTVSLTYNPGYLGLQIRAHATHILTGFHYNNVGTSV